MSKRRIHCGFRISRWSFTPGWRLAVNMGLSVTAVVKTYGVGRTRAFMYSQWLRQQRAWPRRRAA